MKIEGQYRIGEAAGAAPRAHLRANGRQWGAAAFWLTIPLFAAATWFLTAVVATMFGADPVLRGWLMVIGAWPGILLGQRVGRLLCAAISRRQIRERLTDRGMSDPFPVAFELTDEALVISQGQLTHVWRWPAVSDLFRVGGFWVFVAQGDPAYLRRNMFLTAEAERAFLAEALNRMPQAARTRSREAMAVAGVA